MTFRQIVFQVDCINFYSLLQYMRICIVILPFHIFGFPVGFFFFNDFYRSFFEVQKMISLAVSDVLKLSFSGNSKHFFKNVYHFFSP